MTRHGGCLCGAVRYRLNSEPLETGWCHCRNCQKASGGPAMVATTIRAGDYVVEQGAEAIGSVRVTDFCERRFCARCGTPLTFHYDFQPETVDVTVPTLDDPGDIEPGFHIFYASRIRWAETCDDLPRHDAFRPDTRGLAM